MNELKEFVKENPQVLAAIITGFCGFLGVFINIIINIVFRNQDYKNKNKIKKIENMDLYYLPLLDLLRETLTYLRTFEKENIDDFSNILSNAIGSKYDYQIEKLKDNLTMLKDYLNAETYRFQDNYSLFKKHREFKYKVNSINGFILSQKNEIEVKSVKIFIEEIEELALSIRYCEAKTMTHNLFGRLLEYYRIFKANKTKEI